MIAKSAFSIRSRIIPAENRWASLWCLKGRADFVLTVGYTDDSNNFFTDWAVCFTFLRLQNVMCEFRKCGVGLLSRH